ncbi:MAG: efflux transporter outer membrane subunit [Desulfobacter sp.]
MNRFLTGVLLIAAAFFSGCMTTAPDPALQRPDQVPDMPPAFRRTTADQAPGIFNTNEELSSLLDQVRNNNFDIRVLQARVDQEAAELKKETASLFPDLDLSFGGERAATRTKTDNASATEDGSHSWDASLSASFTPDVWGELEAGRQAQALDLLAAELDLKNALLEKTTEAAQAWVDIIAARSEKAVLDQQVEINQTLLKLQALRFSNGQASALDVSQQREALAEAASQRPVIERTELLLLNSLALLAGQSDVNTVSVTARELPSPVPLPATGMPADLLENRPDIQAAWMRFAASKQDIEKAKADRLPAFSLSADALFSSGQLDLLFQNWVATLAASITAPLFDAGERRAEVARTEAAAREQAALYAQTVSQAIRDVEDSLVSIDRQAAFIRLLEEQLATARLTLKDAMLQYRNGQASYLSYLTAWTNIELLERQLIGEKATYLKERIGLYAALGLSAMDGPALDGRQMNTRTNTNTSPEP